MCDLLSSRLPLSTGDAIEPRLVVSSLAGDKIRNGRKRRRRYEGDCMSRKILTIVVTLGMAGVLLAQDEPPQDLHAGGGLDGLLSRGRKTGTRANRNLRWRASIRLVPARVAQLL